MQRELSHHQIGRHSVASQAATSGHSIKAIQAQLGHQSAQSTHLYAHISATRRSLDESRRYGLLHRLISTSGRWPPITKSVAPQVLVMISRGDWIRTSDLMLPKHAHYQAVLHPVTFNLLWSGGMR